MEFIGKNQDAFSTSILAITIGFLGKKMLGMNSIPTNSIKQVFYTFVVISAAGIGANEIKEKYPIKYKYP